MTRNWNVYGDVEVAMKRHEIQFSIETEEFFTKNVGETDIGHVRIRAKNKRGDQLIQFAEKNPVL